MSIVPGPRRQGDRHTTRTSSSHATLLRVLGALIVCSMLSVAFAQVPVSLIGRSIPALVRHVRAVSVHEIDDLAGRAMKAGGTREVGKILGVSAPMQN